MNELIKINYENENPTVSGRDLHEFLGIETKFSDWINRMLEYGFTDEKDFYSFLSESTGGRPAAEYALTIDMAKEICMIQRNDKGKEARQYFIEVEKKYNQQNIIPVLDSKFLFQLAQKLEANEKIISEQKEVIAVLTPKADFFDQVTDSTDAIDIGEAAKVLNMGIGRNNLFKFLRYKGVLMPNNQPYQEFCDREYFRTIEQKYSRPDGSIHINIKTVVYQRGLDFIRRMYINEKGGFKLIEAN